MLKKAVKFVADTLLEEIGYPASLVNFLATDHGFNRPLAEPRKSIAASDVVKWGDFGALPYGYRDLQLQGWTYSSGCRRNYGSTTRIFADLQNLAVTQVIKNWECEIQGVDGFSASKSELTHFKSMEAMVERNSPEMIDAITQEKLDENLAWDEIRIIHEVDHDHFQTWSWDGRVFLMNDGGSHHFAAAKYVAARIDVKVPLRGEYRIQTFNQVALAGLRREFDIFVMSGLFAPKNLFHDAMESIQATYYWKELPKPYIDQYAVFLPNAEKKSARVAKILREAGFQNLGSYLNNLDSK